MLAGKTVGTGVRRVSKDGKTLTFGQKGTHADGTKYHDVLVYDRQLALNSQDGGPTRLVKARRTPDRSGGLSSRPSAAGLDWT